MGGSSAAAVIFQACGIPDQELLVQSPVQLPEDLVSGIDNWYATLCRQCATSEGLIVRVVEGRAKKVEGNPDYPINTGKHGPRCESGLQALYHPDRLSRPKRRDRSTGALTDISWNEAFSILAERLVEARRNGNAHTVLMATNPLRGHLAMVVDRFIGAYGGQHVGHETIEETVYRQAVREVFGQEALPDLDIANSRYILSFGADFLGTWLSPVRHARGYGVFRDGTTKERGTLVHVSSRFSLTAANADKWVYVNPGTEGFLALSIAHVIVREGWGNSSAARTMTGGAMASHLQEFAPDRAEAVTGVARDRIEDIAREFAESRPSLAIGGGTAGAYTNGLFNLKAALALNYLSDSVNSRGGVIFNPEPPLADVPARANVASFSDWRSIAERMRSGNPTPVSAAIFRGINPVYGLPQAAGFREALQRVPFVASFSSFMDETTAVADLILPEHSPLESWGDDVPDPGPGYQVVGFQQPVVRPFFENEERNGFGTRDFGDVILSLAEELGLQQALPWNSMKDVLMDGARRLHSAGNGSVRSATFSGFWNGVLQRGGWWDTGARSRASVSSAPPLPSSAVPPSFDGPSGGDTFYLMPFSSISVGDGSGAHLPWLQATPDPITTAVWRTWVEINSRVAKDMGIHEGDVIQVESSNGSITALAYPHPAISPDVVCIPFGQGHTSYGRYASNRGSNVMSILAPQTDQDTGALAWASTRVRIRNTGRWVRLPKFEGVVPAFPAEDRPIIEITNHS